MSVYRRLHLMRSGVTGVPLALVLFALSCPPFVLSQRQHPEKQSGRQLVVESVKQLPSSEKRFALVIGVDAYADTQITTLGGAANDAKALRDALVAYAGFPSEQVTLLATDQPQERQPTRGNILRRLSNLAAVVPKDGLLLVSFAGHGIEREGEAFLLPSDAQVANDVDLLEQTAINVTTMKDRIRRTGVGQVVLILDACRNDPVGRGGEDNPLTTAYTNGFNFNIRNQEVTAFATLYATDVGHRAYEYKEKRQGYFTWWLVEGLKGGAANASGEVTLGGLVRYLQARVPQSVLLDLGAGKIQRPYVDIGGYRADELVLAIVNRASPAVTTSTRTMPVAEWGSGRPMMTPTAAPKRSVKMQAGIELAYIPAGEFQMGSENGFGDDKPVHRVTIKEGFYMGKYEVTQGQWEAVMGSNPSNFKGANLPVEQVSWSDAREFINKLNAMNDGYTYRLPSEAEWEYACQAGTMRDYAGDIAEMAWYEGNSNKTTHPVGSKRANRWGLYDLFGNVDEWCEDWYHDTYAGAPTDGSAWDHGGEQKYRVLRGGDWGKIKAAYALRLTGRLPSPPDHRAKYFGFRVAASPQT